VHPTELIPLSKYAAPAMPTEHALRAAWRRLQQRIGGNDGPMLPSAGLERGSLLLLDDLADPPACAPQLQALEHNLAGWARSHAAAPRMQLVIVPPCDRTGAIETWARSAGHALLAAPSRLDLFGSGADIAAGGLSGDGLLVIPRLERWFVRQRNGLRVVRSLLAQLAASDRRCLVGCDSWAWAYLVKAASAELMLPQPRTFEACDAARLRRWFAELATVGGDGASFRLARNGEDVLACDDDGEPRSKWLRELAARSGGIPWVAWHLWRAGLQLRADDTTLSERAARAVADDKRTVWVVDPDDARLPLVHEDRMLLALQALLIHGGLTAAELEAVLPATGDADVLPALVESGHLRRDRGLFSVRPSAYPAVRQALLAADFPVGAM
jgi:hypothetical protein